MRKDYFKQCACISETDPQVFQEHMNGILGRITNPEIIMDRCKPFTAYIYYKVSKDAPETLLELLEMLEGKSYTCGDCPHFQRDTDKRKSWHTCRLRGDKTREDSRACEELYRMKRAERDKLIQEYEQIPYTIE